MTPRPSGHYWAACGKPFRSSTRKKTNTRGREETRSGTKKLCSHNLFYTIVPCTSIFCTSPAPRTVPKVASKGARDCAVVRALASHQCVPGSTPGVDTICGLSLLLVLFFALRDFSPGTPVFPSPQKPTLPNSNSIWNARTRLNEFI